MPASAAAPAPPNAPPPPPPPPPPTAAAPTSLQAFLENNGLGQFFTAFEMFGVSGLEDFAEGTHFDDETCRDIGACKNRGLLCLNCVATTLPTYICREDRSRAFVYTYILIIVYVSRHEP